MSHTASSVQVLLIDDSAVNQLVLSGMLKKICAFEVIVHQAKNSDEAISQFVECHQQLDVIICDGNLGNSPYQGPELTDILLTLQHEYALNIPIYAWTDDESKLYKKKTHPP